MEIGRSWRCGMSVVLTILLSLASASPVLPSLEHSVASDSDSVYTCNTPWQQFHHLCWLAVPLASSLHSSPEADFFCSQLDARALHLRQQHFCVKDAIRLGDDNTGINLFGLDMGVMQKRLMGNNGY